MTLTLTLTAFADLDEDASTRITVRSDFRMRDSIKAVPGARWDDERRVWTVPLSWPSCLALFTEFPAPSLEVGDKLLAWGKAHRKRVDLLRDLRTRLTLDGADLPPWLTAQIEAVKDEPGMARLFPYQWVAAVSVRLAGDYLLLDDMGLGKTAEALAGLRLRAESRLVFPVLIVCPKSVIGVWADEISLMFPGAIIRKVRGTPTQVTAALAPGADFYVINYELMRRYSRLAPFGSIKLSETEQKDGLIQHLKLATVIADEIHRAANASSKQTRAVWQAMNGPYVTTRLGLTGTPIQDSPEQLWSPLRAVAPHEYGGKTAFLERFTIESYNFWGGREIIGMNPLTQREFEGNFHARSRRIVKEAALPFLPPKVYETRWVELPTSMRTAYRDMKTSLIAELESGDTLEAASVLEKAIRLLQLANASGTVGVGIDGKPTFTMALPSPKIEAFLTDLDAGDFPGQVAVFTDSKQLADLLMGELERKGYKAVAITGAVTGADRDEAIRQFQAGEARVVVFTRAGGEGITLTAANVLVRLFRAWSYTVHTQVEDRLHRIGAEIHPHVTIIDYLAERTLEEGQLARLAKKEAMADEVLRDKDLLRMLKAEAE